jgi:DNA-binding transcriptional ArsR family regulator
MMGRIAMSEELLPQVARHFKALSEPARLQLLRALQRGERTVNDLVALTAMGQANVSKHLQVLHAHGFVRRRKAGLFVYYALADREVVRLCETVCQRVLMVEEPPPVAERASPVG